MKKSIFILFSVFLIFAITSGVYAAEGYKDGTYVAYEPDDYGDLVIEYVIERGRLVDVNMINPFRLNYDYEPAKIAFLEYPYKALIAENPANVDVVSGATNSCESYNKAAEMALSIADGSYEGNKYYGVAENFASGHVLIEIIVEGEEITNARFITANSELGDHGEMLMPAKSDDSSYAAAVEYFNSFPKKVVENQGNVDLVSGATDSYHNFNDALDMAMKQAGLK
nr:MULTISPECIES: FMN-binding protein [unclassified Halanaerobium]